MPTSYTGAPENGATTTPDLKFELMEFPMFKMTRTFWTLTVLVFGLVTVFSYFPVLFGKVPFPRDMVLQFPAWNGMARSEGWQSAADIGDLITWFYPARTLARLAGRQGTLPLWNPYVLGGAPFFANP